MMMDDLPAAEWASNWDMEKRTRAHSFSYCHFGEMIIYVCELFAIHEDEVFAKQ